MKCPKCEGRRKVSTPCQVGHTNIHDCYDAGCLLPKACQTCAGSGEVVTDAMLNNPAALLRYLDKKR